MNDPDHSVPAAQRLYARWLDWGTRASLAMLVGSFFIYAFGVIAPWVPLAELPALWSLPLDRYLEATSSPAGWGWLWLLDRGDYLNFAGIAALGLVSVVCYLRVLPSLLAGGERLQAGVAIAQVIVLTLAASGVLAGGH